MKSQKKIQFLKQIFVLSFLLINFLTFIGGNNSQNFFNNIESLEEDSLDLGLKNQYYFPERHRNSGNINLS
ncbi:MAG: hypothetical protein ACOC4M_07205, partial [Promethearchaeia archaeon]